MSILSSINSLLTWHILFQAFVKYLHCKHLNKILFEIINFGFLQHFSEAIKNTSSSTTKIQMIKKNVSTEANYYYTKFSQVPTLNKKIIYMTCLMKIHL